MSGATTPAPKAMSSRLLTMKFMQRAAASPTASPTASDEPSPKRRKTDSKSTPSKYNVDALADQRAIQAAMASEEAKRQIAIEKQAAEAGDTRWVLSFEDQDHVAASSAVSLRIIQAGFANIDADTTSAKYMDDEEEDKPNIVGRRSFGKFNRVIEKQQDPSTGDATGSADETDEDEEEESEGASDEDDPTSELIKTSRQQATERFKTERKAKRKADKAESTKLAKERKKREVSLNNITSLSGRQAPTQPNIKCFVCEGPHRKADCPHVKRRHDGPEDGPPRKNRKSN